MKILFDLRNTGLGNGGGSITLIKSANVLSNLGHDVIIIDGGRNQCTWTKLKVEHKIIKNINSVPNSDVVISTGFRSIIPTLNLPDRCGKKLVWIRGWETWVYDEKKIIKLFKNECIIKIVNSIGLQNKLKKYNIDSYLIRPGNDFDDFSLMNIRNNKNIVLGGLYHIKHKTKRSDLVIDVAKKLKKKYKNIKLYMFGTPNNPNISVIDKYVSQPSIKEKNKFFNNIDIWLSTSELEGLHIIPQEVMLTECCIVGTNSKMGGTLDYLINKKTGLISNNNLNDFTDKVEILIKDKNLRNKLSINGRNKIITLGDRKNNMEKFVKLFVKLLENK